MWRGATHVGVGSLTLGGREVQMGTQTLTQEEKEKRSRLPWNGTKSISPFCVKVVKNTCKSTIMANCVVLAGRFFSINRPWSVPTLQAHHVFEEHVTRSRSS